MKDYELLYIVSGGLTEAEAAKVSDDVGNALAKLGGQAEESADGPGSGSGTGFWGRRRLAYMIGQDDHGWYAVTRFSMDPAKLDDFQKALNLDTKIIRTVLVNADQVPTPEEAAQAKEAAEAAESDKDKEEKAAAPPARSDGDDVPEEIKKTVKSVPTVSEKKTAPKTEETAAEKPAPAKPVDEKERQAQLDEKLGDILKD